MNLKRRKSPISGAGTRMNHPMMGKKMKPKKKRKNLISGAGTRTRMKRTFPLTVRPKVEYSHL